MNKNRHALEINLNDLNADKKNTLNNFSIKLAQENKELLSKIVNNYNTKNGFEKFNANSIEFDSEYNEFRQEIYWKLHPVYNQIIEEVNNIFYNEVAPKISIILNNIEHIRVINIKDNIVTFESFSGVNTLLDNVKYKLNCEFNKELSQFNKEYNVEILSYENINLSFKSDEIIHNLQLQIDYILDNEKI